MRFPGFIGPGYTLQSVASDCQRCVNWYPEANELGTQANGEIGSLIQAPGHRLLTTLGQGPIRAIWATSTGRLAVVSGNQLYRVGADWTSKVAGSLESSDFTKPVSMADNGSQIIVVDGTAGYIVSMADGSMNKITNTEFLGGQTVIFQDGYFISVIPNSGQFCISDLYNGFDWSALDFAVAEGSPDNVVSVVSNMRQVWLFGEQTTEVWWNSGDQDFPFTRIDGAFIEFGCAAPKTAQKFNNAIVWLGGGDKAAGIVWMSQNFTPKRISNHAVEFAIQQAGDLSTTTAFVYQYNGHAFYCLNLPDKKTTWVYDSATEQWHERAYFTNGELSRQRGDNHAFCYGTHIVGDYANGNIYALDVKQTTDNGAPIVRLRTAPHMADEMVRVFYDEFKLDMAGGIGLDGFGSNGAGLGVDPQIGLSWSDDYGHSWSPEIYRSVGPLGAYRTQARWQKMGQSRNRVYRVKITDPVVLTLLGADLRARKGMS